MVEKPIVNTFYITKCIHFIHYFTRKNIAIKKLPGTSLVTSAYH